MPPYGGIYEDTACPVGRDPLIPPSSDTAFLSRMAYLFAVPAKSGMPPYGGINEDAAIPVGSDPQCFTNVEHDDRSVSDNRYQNKNIPT